MGRCKRTFCTIISRLPQIYHMQTYIWSILIHDDSCAWQIQQCTSWNAGEKCNYKPHADTHTHTSFPSLHTRGLTYRDLTQLKSPQTPEIPAAECLHPPTPAAALSSTGLTVARPRVHSPSHPRPSARTHVRPALARQQPAGKRGSGGLGAGPGGRAGASWGRASAPREGTRGGRGAVPGSRGRAGAAEGPLGSLGCPLARGAGRGGGGGGERRRWRRQKRRGGRGRRRTGADRRCELPGAQS